MHSNEEQHMRAHGAAPNAQGMPAERTGHPAHLGWDWGPPRGGRIGFAACGGGSGDPPHIASVGTNPSQRKGTPTTTQPIGRSNPAPGRVGGVHTQPWRSQPSRPDHRRQQRHRDHYAQRLANAIQALSRKHGPCSNYLLSAEAALRGGQAHRRHRALLRRSRMSIACGPMESPNYPIPSGRRHQVRRHWYQHDSTAFENADELCSKKTGTPYYAPGRSAGSRHCEIHQRAGRCRQSPPASAPGADSGSESAEISLPND